MRSRPREVGGRTRALKESKTVLAIDPGTHKSGMALVRRISTGGREAIERVWSEVVPTEHVIPKLHEAHIHDPFQLIIVGGGTGSESVIAAVRDHLPSMGLLVVDEENTTLQARERYWEHHPRRGLRRLLPASLQEPPRPYDDFAALILAERVLLGR